MCSNITNNLFSTVSEKERVFWVSEGKDVYFIPNIDNIIEWWGNFCQWQQNNTKSGYIFYSNGGKYQSGITIDSDIHVYIDEKEYIQEIDPDFDLDQEQHIINAKFKEVIKDHPYLPKKTDVDNIQHLCGELLAFINGHFQTPQGELYPIDNYIIVCRHNISFDDTKHTADRTYYRYGFHAYIFDCTFDHAGKTFIKNHFKLSEELQEIAKNMYPQTRLDQFFDLSPISGTTSLPMTSKKEKEYLYYFINGQIKTIKKNMQIMMQLNPFRGNPMILQPQYVEVDMTRDNLVEILQRQQLSSYEASIKFCYEKFFIKQFYDNFQLQTILRQFSHPSFDIRFKIVQYLYGFIYDSKKVNQSALMTQVCFYIIMAENVEDILGKKYDKDSTDWMAPYKDRARGPELVFKFATQVITDQKIILEPSKAYIRLFKLYNEERKKNNLETIEFDPLRSISYSKFINFLNVAEDGIYVGHLFTLLTKWKKTMRQILFSYAFQQMESNMLVYNGKFYYFQQREEEKEFTVIDYNKFHQVEPQDIEAKMVELIREITKGTTQQIKYLQESNFELWQFYKLGEKPESEDEKAFCKKCDTYFHLQEFLADYSEICRQSRIANNLLVEKLSYQKYIQQIDTQPGCFGVYNGVLFFRDGKFNFYSDFEAKRFQVSRSCMFMIRQEFLDQNSQLTDPDHLPEYWKKIYNEVYGIYEKIYAKKDIDVFQWLIFQIFYRMIEKNVASEKLFIDYGTGGDGKTSAMQAIVHAMGQGNQTICSKGINRTLIGTGYAAQAKSSILQTKDMNSSQHDSGGLIQLEGCYFCLMTELAESQPIAMSALKKLTCDSGIVAREANEKSVKTFTNKSVMIVQGNSFPIFDQCFDDGGQRRIIFYPHKVKFVTEAQFRKLTLKQKEFYFVADDNIRSKLLTDLEYVDIIGYMCCMIYQGYEIRKIDYVPEKLVKETKILFNVNLQYLPKCLALTRGNIDSTISYKLYEDKINETITQEAVQKKIKQGELKQIIENHIIEVRKYFMQKLFVLDVEGNEFAMSDNDFAIYMTSQEHFICIREMEFINPQINIINQQLIDQFFNKKEDDDK